MSELARIFEKDRFATGIGVELLEVAEGRAVARLAVGPQHLNAAGVVQGGAVFTLADFAFAVASNSRGNLALAIEAHVTFLRAVRTGVLRAEAREEGGSRRLSTCTVRVTDEARDPRRPLHRDGVPEGRPAAPPLRLGLERKAALPLPGQGEEGVRHGRGDRGSPGSPIPPGAAVLGTMWVSTRGISEMCRGSWSGKLVCWAAPFEKVISPRSAAERP